jgi:hypothetical protein
MSHINYAHLFFSSTKNSQVGGFIRSAFHDILFDDKIVSQSQKDYLKPIYIYRGHDSINSIGVPTSGHLTATDVLKKQMNVLFGVE